jgi:hypothetical protein
LIKHGVRDVLRLRALDLQAAVLAAAHVDTLCIKLLKVAAVVMRNTRRNCLCLVCTLTSERPATHGGFGGACAESASTAARSMGNAAKSNASSNPSTEFGLHGVTHEVA